MKGLFFLIFFCILCSCSESSNRRMSEQDKQINKWSASFVPKYRNLEKFDKKRVYISPFHARWIAPAKPPLIAAN